MEQYTKFSEQYTNGFSSPAPTFDPSVNAFFLPIPYSINYGNHPSIMMLRRLFSVLLTGWICLSCTNDESVAQAANVQLVKEVHLLINQHNWKELSNLFADSVSLKGATGGSQITRQSKQQCINNYRKMQQTFPQLSQHITQLYAAGTHHVIVETIAEGMATDSILLSRSSCTIFTIENQKISRLYIYHPTYPLTFTQP